MRVQAIFKRILLQRRGDKRSLVLLFLAPLVILTLLYFLLQIPSNQVYRVGIISPAETEISSALKKSTKIDFVTVSDDDRETMNEKDLSAIVRISDNAIDVTYGNRDSGTSRAISLLLMKEIQQVQMTNKEGLIEKTIKDILSAFPQLQSQIPLDRLKDESLEIKSHYLYGDANLSLFENFAPVLVAFFVFFFVFLISGISLVNERSSGTLTRMLISPVKRSEIITGYTLAYGLLAVVQTVLVVLWARYVLGMTVLGNFAWVLLINLLIALIALLIGLLLSSLARTEFQFVQFIPIAVVPQFLFSGIINVDTMARPLQWIAHAMPLYYGVDALQKVVKQGMGFREISFDLLLLIGITTILYFANVMALKKLRRT